MRSPHALTVDLEEWFDAEFVRRHGSVNRISTAESGVSKLLDLFEKYRVRATFFVVGTVARALPDLIRRVQREGHEIACHGLTHRPLWELSKAEFRRELQGFQETLDDILGPTRVYGFRAPTFSLETSTAWAIDVLQELDYLYDSSVFPFRTPLYGLPDAPHRPYYIRSDALTVQSSGGILEFPLTVARLGRWTLPVAGGFYLRALPTDLLVGLLKKVAKHRPLILYVHPWECSTQTPRVRLPLLQGVITYYGIRSTLAKVERLLQAFSFCPLIDLARLHLTSDRRKQAARCTCLARKPASGVRRFSESIT